MKPSNTLFGWKHIASSLLSSSLVIADRKKSIKTICHDPHTQYRLEALHSTPFTLKLIFKKPMWNRNPIRLLHEADVYLCAMYKFNMLCSHVGKEFVICYCLRWKTIRNVVFVIYSELLHRIMQDLCSLFRSRKAYIYRSCTNENLLLSFTWKMANEFQNSNKCHIFKFYL